VRIVVLGAGDVGTFIAKELSAAGHDVVLVDRSAQALSFADERADVLTLRGNVTRRLALRQAKVDAADLVVAVTGSDETNLVAAGLAAELGARRTAARVDDPDFFDSHSGVERGVLGIHLILCASRLVCDELIRLVQRLESAYVGQFAGNGVQVVLASVNGSRRALGRAPRDVDLGDRVDVVGVVRDGSLRAPHAVDRLEDDDALLLSGTPEHVLSATVLIREASHRQRAIVVGGGDVGSQVAERLSRTADRVMLVEHDACRCEELAQELSDVTVVSGDGTSLAVLQDEHAETADVALSATHADEVNLMSALMLRDLGVKNVFALVHRPGYAEVYAHLGVNGTASVHDAILSIVRRTLPGTGVVGSESLQGTRHELLEVLLPGTVPSGTRLADIALPPDAHFVALVRRGTSLRFTSDSPIERRDILVVAALPHSIRNVERAVRQLRR